MSETSSNSLLTPLINEYDLNSISLNAAHDLEKINGARILITGGTGYIGRWLLESICHANRCLNIKIAAVVLTRDPDVFANKCPHLVKDSSISFIKGDVRDRITADGCFTHVIHAATDIAAASEPLELFDVTVLGTRRVLNFASERGVKDVLLLSSGAVYGKVSVSTDRIAESCRVASDVTSVNAAYGLGKIATEWLGNAFGQKYGFSCKSARVFAQIGPCLNLDIQFAAGNFIRDALMGQPLLIKGDGTPMRSYMYATDLVVWLWAILVRGDGGRSYNVGSDYGISILELARAIKIQSKACDSVVQVCGQQMLPSAAPDRYVPDIKRARAELSVDITVHLEDALQRTIDWYRPQFQRRQR